NQEISSSLDFQDDSAGHGSPARGKKPVESHLPQHPYQASPHQANPHQTNPPKQIYSGSFKDIWRQFVEEIQAPGSDEKAKEKAKEEEKAKKMVKKPVQATKRRSSSLEEDRKQAATLVKNKSTQTANHLGTSLEGHGSLEGQFSLEGSDTKEAVGENMQSQANSDQKKSFLLDDANIWSQEAVLRGLVMGEILGPPKAQQRSRVRR
ncbi:MAG: hypothetical protein RR396_01245, partial [Clostridiales bacterium]